MGRIPSVLAALAILAASLPLSAGIAPNPGSRLSPNRDSLTAHRAPRKEPLQQPTLLPSSRLSTNFNYTSSCTVYVDEPQYAFYDWLAGDEIYYAYQDLRFPKVACDTTYPFVVTHIGMTLVLNAPGTFNVQVFLATVDPLFSSPVCPVPYELIYITDEYPINIPAPDVYTFMIALEEPAPVYEPYFACIYFGSDMTPFYPGLAIDTAAYLCINYNEWGEGLIDLANNDYYSFPGSLHLFSVGYSRAGLQPIPRFIMPRDSGVTFPGKPIWAAERNDKQPYASAKFDYFKSGQWFEIGGDFSGAVANRDGVTAVSGNPDGWSTIWNPFGLPEGNYLVRVSIADSDSTYVSDTATVYLDLKSLEPSFTSRTDLMSACGAESVKVTVADENPIAVNFGFRYLTNTDERNLPLLNRTSFGDANGNPNDGNHNYNGEFGEFYVAPTLFTSFFKYWFAKGYVDIMAEGATFLNDTQMAETLAVRFNTRANLGTQDDNLLDALNNHLKSHGDRIVPGFMRRPNWNWFKNTYLGRQATVAFAIDSPFGNWLGVQKIDYANAKNDSFPVTYYDPIGGILRESFLIAKGDSLVLGYLPNNKKYRVSLGAALYPKLEALTYTQFFTDFDGLNGFAAVLPPQYFQEDLLYLIRARAIDANNGVGDGYWLMKYDCVKPVKRGDADSNGAFSIADAVFLVNYIFAGGPAPNPYLNGDADCNGALSIADAVFLINYIFAGGAAPCP